MLLNNAAIATTSIESDMAEIQGFYELLLNGVLTVVPIVVLMVAVSLGFKILMHSQNMAAEKTSTTEKTSTAEESAQPLNVSKMKKYIEKKMKKNELTVADQRKLFDAVLTLFNYRLKAPDAPLSVKIEHIQKFIKKYDDTLVDFAITEQHILVQAAWEWLCAHENTNFEDDNVINGQFQKLKVELAALIEKTYVKVKEAEQSLISDFLEEEKRIVNELESTVDELREQLKVSKEMQS